MTAARGRVVRWLGLGARWPRIALRWPDVATRWRGIDPGWLSAVLRWLNRVTHRVPRVHPSFAVVFLIALAARVDAILAYPPGLWTPDSLRYVTLATQLIPYQVQPVGYPVMLRLLQPAHSLVLVTTIQHAMGLASGALIYALLRRRFGLSPWWATLAAAPPLLSAYTIQIEHFVLSDTPFAFLVTLAVVAILWRPMPRVVTCGVVGLLLALAALVRSQGLLLAVPFGIYLVARLASRSTLPHKGRGAVWRVLAGLVALVAGLAAPLLYYAWWFESYTGTFQLTTSTGAYLYARVSTFAECSVIKPPADEQWLCYGKPVGQRPNPGYYVWQKGSPLRRAPNLEFTPQVNHLAIDFALRAIKAQPLGYLAAAWHSTVESFTLHRDPGAPGQSQTWYVFPQNAPNSVPKLVHLTTFFSAGVKAYEHGNPSTRLVQPYASIIRGYQRVIVVPGPLLGAIVLLGLSGVLLCWRRLGGRALLPWLTGVTLIVTPAATADFDARYLVASVPPLCIAAAIGLKERRPASRILDELPGSEPTTFITTENMSGPAQESVSQESVSQESVSQESVSQETSSQANIHVEQQLRSGTWQPA